MSVLERLRSLLFTSRIANCCGCRGKDITVWTWEKNGTFYAKIQCDTCGREKVFNGGDSEDDILAYTINKWNDECDFWKHHERTAKQHSRHIL